MTVISAKIRFMLNKIGIIFSKGILSYCGINRFLVYKAYSQGLGRIFLKYSLFPGDVI